MMKLELGFIVFFLCGCIQTILCQTNRQNIDGGSDISRNAYESLLLEAEEVFTSELYTVIFEDPKVWECLSPMICSLLGDFYYYNPYKNKCIYQSYLHRVLKKPKPTYPEFVSVCKDSDMLFLEFLRKSKL